jgi:hypothetical protein
MRVQGIARRSPILIGNPWPPTGHGRQSTAVAGIRWLRRSGAAEVLGDGVTDRVGHSHHLALPLLRLSFAYYRQSERRTRENLLYAGASERCGCVPLARRQFACLTSRAEASTLVRGLRRRGGLE